MYSPRTHLPFLRHPLWSLFGFGLLMLLASFGASTILIMIQFGCYFIGVNDFYFFNFGFLSLDEPRQILQLSLSGYLILSLYKLLLAYFLHIRQILSIFEIISINLLLAFYRVLYRYLLLLLLILTLAVEDAVDIDGYPALLLHIY